MRDPLSWSIPLFRAFGIQVRLHIFYIVITLGLILRAAHKSPNDWVEYTLIFVVLLFAIILLHEFGHCFAARREGGDAEEILMWPLGGLAFCEVPHQARAHFVTAIGGPLVNVVICIVCAAVLIPAKYVPPLNPFDPMQVVSPRLYNWQDGTTHYKAGTPVFHNAETGELVDLHGNNIIPFKESYYQVFEGGKKEIQLTISDPKHYDSWVLWTARLYWLSWFLFLLNLLPAFPLDGGRILQSLVWGSTGDYRRGTMTAVYAGFIVAILFLFVSLWSAEPMLLGMGIFIWVFCRQQYIALEMSENESVFGYDFSQGYTSLEKDEQPTAAPKPKKLGPIKRWLQARRERKAQQEALQKAADEARMDDLLDKIHRQGKESLTDEERRFMARVSAQYRNRS